MWIEPGIINYKLIIPMIYPFLYQIRRLIHKEDEKPFYEFFTNYCGYLFSGLIYLIIICRMKQRKIIDNINSFKTESFLELSPITEDLSSKSDSKNTNKKRIKKSLSLTKKPIIHNQINFEKERIHSKNNKKKYLFIFLLTCIYLIPMYLDSFCSTYESFSFKTSSSVSLFFCIIAYVVFSRIILGNKIYKHQLISLIVIIICNVVSIILLLVGEDNSHLILNIILMAIILSLYALYNTLEKNYFNTFMDSPYHLMFVVGLISLCFILPYEIITVLASSKNEIYNGIFYQIELNFEKTKLYPLIFVADVISAFLWIAGIHLTVYFFSPCHFIISESISQILSTLINQTLKGRSAGIKVSISILFVIIIIAALIYNEVIIINLWDLNENTRKNIIQRESKEKEEILENQKQRSKSMNFDSTL